MKHFSSGQYASILCALIVLVQAALAQGPPNYQVGPPPNGPYLQGQRNLTPPPNTGRSPSQPSYGYETVPTPPPSGYSAPGAPQNASPQPPLTPGPAGQGLVLGVEVVGNEFVKSSRIYQELRTRKDRAFDQAEVQADVRRLHRTDLFSNVKTYTSPGPGGVFVRFQVFERPLVRGIRFVGNWHFLDRTLMKQITIEPGKPLNTYSVDENRQRLEEHYRSKGFPKATVSVLEGNKPGDSYVIYVINEGHLERISHVRFVGNDPNVISGQRLKTFIESKPGVLWYFLRGTVDRDKIDADVKRITAYYRSLGYFRARVGRELEYDHNHKWLTLTFVINEGPRYTIRNVAVIGNEKFDSDSLIAGLNLKPGDYFNLPKMNRDVQEIRNAYGEKGHVYVDVQADPRFLEEPGQLNLIYQIQEGEQFSVGKIHVHIEGEAPHTRQSVVLNRMIGIYPGEIFNNKMFEASKITIGRSQLFESNPAQGKEPRFEIRRPKLADIAEREPKPRQRTGAGYRGQSPTPKAEPDYKTSPTLPVHVHVSPLR